MEKLGFPCPLAPWWFPDMATLQLPPRFPWERRPTNHKLPKGNGARAIMKKFAEKSLWRVRKFDGDLSIAPWFGGNEISSFWISMYFYPNSFFLVLNISLLTQQSLHDLRGSPKTFGIAVCVAPRNVWITCLVQRNPRPPLLQWSLLPGYVERLFSAFPTHKSRSSLPLKPKKDRDNS